MLEGSHRMQVARAAGRGRRRVAPPRSALVLAAAALAAAGTGCSGSPSDPDDRAQPRGRPAPTLLAATAVSGGRPREQAVLRAVLAGMERSTLRQVAIGPTDARRQTSDGPAVPLTFTPVGGTTARRQWDQWIVAGAFSRRLLAAGLPATVDGSDPGGGFTALPRVAGQPDPQPPSAAREAGLVEAVRAAARASGARVAALDVSRPYGLALALSLAPDDPAAFLVHRLRPLLQELETHRPQLEGFYLAVLDPEGRLALEFGSWTRNHAGSYWVRRDLASCSPIRQSDPPGSTAPPPCPV